MQKIINNTTDEEIKEEGRKITAIYCEKCSYETKSIPMNEAVFRINMHGGYFMYDGEGGTLTKCPLCGNDSLVIAN